MSAEAHIKTLCPLCDGAIEFPAQAFGDMANCPHCQNLIELGKPSEPPVKLPPLPKPPAEPFPFYWVLGWMRWKSKNFWDNLPFQHIQREIARTAKPFW